MAWARLDDRWHDHPKVIAAGLEAAGLWTMCLTWVHADHRRAQANGQDVGVVPDAVLVRFAGARAKRLAKRLREVGLFDEHTPAGWPIHDYVTYLPKYDPAQAREAGAAGGRARARRAKQTASEPLTEPPAELEADEERSGQRTQARGGTGASAPRNPEPEPEPEPEPTSLPGGSSGRGEFRRGGTSRTREVEPPLRCPRHQDVPADGACGPCGDARREHDAWARTVQARRDAGPVAGTPCPWHPAERAARCPACLALAAASTAAPDASAEFVAARAQRVRRHVRPVPPLGPRLGPHPSPNAYREETA
jgi:hypothetical protein